MHRRCLHTCHICNKISLRSQALKKNDRDSGLAFSRGAAALYAAANATCKAERDHLMRLARGEMAQTSACHNGSVSADTPRGAQSEPVQWGGKVGAVAAAATRRIRETQPPVADLNWSSRARPGRSSREFAGLRACCTADLTCFPACGTAAMFGPLYPRDAKQRPEQRPTEVEFGDWGEQRYADGSVHDMRDTQHRLD